MRQNSIFLLGGACVIRLTSFESKLLLATFAMTDPFNWAQVFCFRPKNVSSDPSSYTVSQLNTPSESKFSLGLQQLIHKNSSRDYARARTLKNIDGYQICIWLTVPLFGRKYTFQSTNHSATLLQVVSRLETRGHQNHEQLHSSKCPCSSGCPRK